MSFVTPLSTTISWPNSSKSTKLKNPSQFRAQTAGNPRPLLQVSTSSINSLSHIKPLGKKLPINIPPSTANTLHNLQESETNLSGRSKTPGDGVKRVLNRGISIETRSRVAFPGVLDLTSVQTFQSQSSFETSNNRNFESPYLLSTNRVKKGSTGFLLLRDEKAERRESRRESTTKLADLTPLHKLDKAMRSTYEKPSIIFTERDIKTYVEKLKTIDQAEERKFRAAGRGKELRELAQANKNQALNLAGLSEKDKERIRSLDVGDEHFFKKLEMVFIGNIQKLEKIERANQIIEVTEGDWVSMNTEGSLEWRYFYVNVSRRVTPMQVFIKTPQGRRTLHVFASRVQKRPNRVNHEYEFENKAHFKIYDKDIKQDQFTTPFLHFAINMDVSGTFSVKVEFGDAEATNLAKGSVSVRADQGGSLSARALVFKPIFSGESDGGFFVTEPSMSMPKRPSTTKKLSVRVDKIQQNMDMEQYNPYNLTERRELQKIKLDENIQNALRNKVEIIRQKRNRHFALMVKNDVKKKLRDIIDDNDNQELLKTRIKEEWMAVVCLAQMGKGLFQMLLKQREVEKERQRKLKIAISLITKVRKFQKFKGKNTNERLTLDIRMALTFRALFSQGNRIKEDQDEKVLKAEDTLVKFLQDSRVVYAIQSKFNVVIETISKVQNAWRDYARRKEGFSTLLSKLWDRNYERIFVTISKGDYVPSMVAKVFDFKSYLKKMFWSDMRGDEQAKDKFIEDYIKVCRERYIKAYDLYDAQKKQIDKKEKNKLTFLELLKTQPTLKALHMSKMQGKTAKGKTRLSIMNEIEGSSRQDLDSEEGSMILKSEPPKMFILPAAEELDEAIANSIAQQIIATLPRSELIKFSFNEKLDNKN